MTNFCKDNEFVLRLRDLMILTIALLLLQSCQVLHKNKAHDAASYNTQLGLAYLNQGDRPRAKRKLLTALAQAPDSPEANASMAYFFEKCGDMERAGVYYRKAMAYAPKNGAQLNNYGAFLCRRGHYIQSESYFLQAIRDTQYIHTAGAYENAGLCAAAIPDYTKARMYFIKALEQDPSRKQSLNELVKIEVKLGHERIAATYLQKYPPIVLSDPTLLALAIKVAHKAGMVTLEANYKLHLQHRS